MSLDGSSSKRLKVYCAAWLKFDETELCAECIVCVWGIPCGLGAVWAVGDVMEVNDCDYQCACNLPGNEDPLYYLAKLSLGKKVLDCTDLMELPRNLTKTFFK